MVAAQPFVPKWAVGVACSRIMDLPGTLFIEKLSGRRIMRGFLRVSLRGELEPDGKYIEDETYDFSLDLGMSCLREIGGDCGFFKLYLGLGPELYYDRYYHTTYSERDSAYHDSYNTHYGAELSAFIKASFTRDMVIKNARFRHELSFVPINLYAGIYHNKSSNYYWTGKRNPHNNINYGAEVITTGSITYSIKYLF